MIDIATVLEQHEVTEETTEDDYNLEVPSPPISSPSASLHLSPSPHLSLTPPQIVMGSSRSSTLSNPIPSPPPPQSFNPLMGTPRSRTPPSPTSKDTYKVNSPLVSPLVSTSPIIESFSKTKNHVPYIPPPTEIEQPVTMETTNQKLPPHLITVEMNRRKSLESGNISRVSYSPAVWPEEKNFRVVVTYIGERSCIYGQPLVFGK